MNTKLSICLGLDGSSTGDWTAIRAETPTGYQFTPQFKVGDSWYPTYWDPSKTGNSIPRHEVNSAVDQLFTLYDVKRMYCDPREFETDIESWALEYGEKTVLKWVTGRLGPMHDALQRFKTDLVTGRITHDDCKASAIHIANATMVQKPGEKYMIGKPHGNYSQKMDLAMASVLAHEASADSRATGWSATRKRPRAVAFQ